MSTIGVRAAIYLRVSRDDQTTENQRLVLERVAGLRGWTIVQTYEDQGISGAKGRDQRPAFDRVLKDAVRRKFDILMVWSIDRLGRSVLHVANALAELDAAGIRLYYDREGIDSSTPMGRAMIQMASVFGEQERSMLRSRVLAGLDRVRQQGKKLGRPKVPPQGRGRYQGASERRKWHLEGGYAGRLREWHCAAREEGDDSDNGAVGVNVPAWIKPPETCAQSKLPYLGRNHRRYSLPSH
jgi:DNA invertase Pin-like site-specific DNA recombinase